MLRRVIEMSVLLLAGCSSEARDLTDEDTADTQAQVTRERLECTTLDFDYMPGGFPRRPVADGTLADDLFKGVEFSCDCKYGHTYARSASPIRASNVLTLWPPPGRLHF